jgi:hypothetical protein
MFVAWAVATHRLSDRVRYVRWWRPSWSRAAPGGRSLAATRRPSRARRLSLTLATPRTDPVRDILVRDTTALIELPDRYLNFIELPAFRLDEGGKRFGGKERLRASRTLGQRLESFLVSVSMRTDRIVVICGGLCEFVYILASLVLWAAAACVVLGVPCSEFGDGHVDLVVLWGDAADRELRERLCVAATHQARNDKRGLRLMLGAGYDGSWAPFERSAGCGGYDIHREL